MTDPGRRPWFGPKRVGFGVRPQSWQGWAAILGLIAVLVVVALVVVLLTAHLGH